MYRQVKSQYINCFFPILGSMQSGKSPLPSGIYSLSRGSKRLSAESTQGPQRPNTVRILVLPAFVTVVCEPQECLSIRGSNPSWSSLLSGFPQPGVPAFKDGLVICLKAEATVPQGLDG